MARNRKLPVLIAAALALALVTAACGSDTDKKDKVGAPAEEAVKTGGTLVFGLEAETNNWLPGKITASNSGALVQDALFDSLARSDAKGDVRPYLAKSITPNDDLTEWTVVLRPGVLFHDGTPLNAEAMKYNYEKLSTTDTSNVRATYQNTFKVTALEAVDELTFKYVLSQGNAAFADVLLDVRPFSPAAHAAFGEDAGSNPVGTGPFKFVRWDRDDKLVVQKWEKYWLVDDNGVRLPYLDEVIFRPIPDEDTRLQTLLAGDIDAMHTLRQSIVRQIQESADGGQIKTYPHIGNNAGGAILNTKQPPVDDKRVRQAMAWALDQDQLVDVLGGTGISPRQTQFFSEDSPWYSPTVAKKWPNNDPVKAKALLKAYVSDPARSDGKPVGSPVTIDFNCPPDVSLIELSQMYQHFWTAVGMQVNLHQVEQATHIQNALGDKYMANCWRMGSGADPYSTLAVTFGDPATQPLNFTNYTDPLIAEQIEVLRTTTEVNVRKGAVEKIMLDLAENVPLTWTGSTATTIGAKPNVKNVAGWRFPDGSKGDGVTQGETLLSWVWRDS